MAHRDANELLPLTPVVLHILLALADERQGKHGYAVAREVEELTDGQIRMGPRTLYGSIQRMLDAELIEEREVARLADVVAIARRKQLLPA
jgi:DNA-binding PadR family transcriptional regulator